MYIRNMKPYDGRIMKTQALITLGSKFCTRTLTSVGWIWFSGPMCQSLTISEKLREFGKIAGSYTRGLTPSKLAAVGGPKVGVKTV